MRDKPGCSYRALLIVVCFSGITTILLLSDDAWFSEMNRMLSEYNQRYIFLPKLTERETFDAFHLKKEIRSNHSNVVILVWHTVFGHVGPIGRLSEGCEMTFDRTAIDVASAVVFHFSDIHDDPSWLPMDQRRSEQRWVWLCVEPPWNTRYVFRKTLTPLNGIFNWTMTYRTDSDIYSPYYNGFANLRVNKTVSELVAEKTASSLGIWVVSNCRPSHRRALIEELQKYVSVDIRGKCTKNPICKGQCAYDFYKRYKFYFSFENSRCKDYITEKFTNNGLTSGAVPVVMGPPRADYEKLAPPNSFIHVDDFPSVSDLAEYLLELHRDDKKYGEYLRWRSIPDFPNYKEEHKKSGWGLLCEKLKNQKRIKTETKIASNLDTWWYGKGYDHNTEGFSICHPDDGPSGTALHGYIVSAYLVILVILCAVTVKFCKFNLNSKTRF